MRLAGPRGSAIAAIGVLALLTACGPRPSASRGPPAPAPPTDVQLPTPEPALDRRDLLAAVAAAAEAYATGAPSPPAVAAVAGRRFTVRMPFGCAGASDADPARGYTVERTPGTLKLAVAPQTWTSDSAVRALVGDADTEAVEGFWVSRPWIGDDRCPRPGAETAPPSAASAPEAATAVAPAPTGEAASPTPSPPAPETVGVAEVFAKGGSRLLRRNGRPYRVTRRLQPDEAPSPQGYRLVVAGRIAQAAPPIRCQGQGPDSRPRCFVLIELDRVTIETAAGEELARWTE